MILKKDYINRGDLARVQSEIMLKQLLSSAPGYAFDTFADARHIGQKKN